MKLLICIMTFLFSSYSLAWGPTGHRAVGHIAQKHLSKKAQILVSKILDGETLARVANWPDKIKSDPDKYSHTYDWHYMTWPNPDLAYVQEEDQGKLLSAIKEQLDKLKQPATSKKDKRFAISFLAHLIGDMHQPLHVGSGTDRGGNDCEVTFHKIKINFHHLWDDAMIDFTRLSYTEFANFVEAANKQKISDIQKGELIDWARESAKIRLAIYPDHIQDYCNSTTGDNKAKAVTIPELGFKYSYQFMPVVERRIFEAGIRLAHLLNQAL